MTKGVQSPNKGKPILKIMKQNMRLRSLLLAVLIGSNLLVFVLSGISLQNSHDQHKLQAETQTQN